MVRSGLWLATCVMAREPTGEQTGLLQATVGMHTQLGTFSDKAEALTRMEVSFQDAIQRVANGSCTGNCLPGNDVLAGINETMAEVLTEVKCSFDAAQQRINDGIASIEACKTTADVIIFERLKFPGVAWYERKLRIEEKAHTDCRSHEKSIYSTVEKTYCAWREKSNDTIASLPDCSCASCTGATWHDGVDGTRPPKPDCLPQPLEATPTPEELLANVKAHQAWYMKWNSQVMYAERDYNGETNGAVKNYHIKDENCDKKQGQFEATYEAFVTKYDDTVATADSCYDTTKATYQDTTIPEVEKEEEHIKALFVTAKKVQCYINVIHNMTLDLEYDLTVCTGTSLGSVHSWDDYSVDFDDQKLEVLDQEHLSIDYTAAPPRPTFDPPRYYMPKVEGTVVTLNFCNKLYASELYWSDKTNHDKASCPGSYWSDLASLNAKHTFKDNADWETLEYGLKDESCPTPH